MVGLSAGTIKVDGWVNSGGGGAGSPAPVFSLVSLEATPVPRPFGASSSTAITIQDRVVNRSVATGVYFDQQMRLLYIGSPGSGQPIWNSSDTSIATVDADGFVTHLASGAVTISVTLGGQNISQTLSLTVQGGTVFEELTGYVAGSLAKHCSDAVDSRIAGKTAGSAKSLYSSQIPTGSPAYTRNTGAWPANLGSALTCISPWNSTDGPRRAGVAISYWHILFAAHYPISNGATIQFITAGNVVVDRAMVSSLTHPSYVPYFPDIVIGLLDEPLPETIVPCKVLPSNWANYLPSVASRFAIPAMVLDQEEKALVDDLNALSGFASYVLPNFVNWEKRYEFWESIITGDSGNPCFLIINGALVLVNTWTYGGAGSGTFVTPQIAAINAMMSQLGGPNSGQLSLVDLSGFTLF